MFTKIYLNVWNLYPIISNIYLEVQYEKKKEKCALCNIELVNPILVVLDQTNHINLCSNCFHHLKFSISHSNFKDRVSLPTPTLKRINDTLTLPVSEIKIK